VLVVGLLLGGAGSNGDHGAQHPSQPPAQAPVSVSAPPSTGAATVSACARVISALPLTLAGQDVRRTVSDPPSGAIQAWGDPAIVLRCGVARPKSLYPGSATEFQDASTVNYDVTGDGDANVWTSVDRAVYIAVTIPSKYQGADVMPIVSHAIATVLKPVCSTDQNEPDPAKLCTRRP
jgi:hypothetical protein